MKTLRLVIISLAFCTIASYSAASELYVSPAGSDANPGTKEKPFKTLEAVRDAGRKIKEPVTIILRKGTYVRSTSFELDHRDSRTTFMAAPGEAVRITGARRIPASLFRPVTDSGILNRLPEDSRDMVLQADLGTLGIRKFSSIKYSGHLLPWVSAQSELFFNGKRMELARFPNDKYTRTGKVINEGTRIRSYSALYWTNDLAEIEKHVGKPLEYPVFNADELEPQFVRWKDADDIWCNLWANEYADMNLKIGRIDYEKNNVHLAQPVNYGLRSNRLVTFFNLLEEIDSPGEWYIDRDSKTLYFYPPSEVYDGSVEISLLEEPLIRIAGASDVTFDGVAVENTCGHGIQMIAGAGNRIVNCSISNVGINGIFMGRFSKEYFGPYYFIGAMFDNPYGVSGGGKDHLVENCEISYTGYSGVFVASGDRLTLEPGNITIRNNHIHHISILKKTMEAGINLYGVGNKAVHNEVSHTPHFAIFFIGNDHIMEYNHIHHACQDARDAGAVYSGRDVSFLGNIIRYNYLHDIYNRNGVKENIFAIYLDDKTSGTMVSDNIFVRTSNSGLKVSGGYMNTIENNIFVDIPAIFMFNGYGKEAFINFVTNPDDSHGLKRKLEQVNFDKSPYAEKYPGIANVQKEGLPDNIVRNNFLIYRNEPLGHAPWLPKPENGINGGWTMAHLIYKNGRFSGEVEDRPYLYPDNLIVNTALENYFDFDPGFVDEEAGDFRLKPNSVILKELPGFRPIPFEKIGRQDK